MIDLYQFTPAFGLANISPHCMKIEAFLRLSDIPFQIIELNDPAKGPKSKLPFIRDNGILIGDSELIMDYLESKYNFRVDGHLGRLSKANQHAFCRMLDNHLYWALVYSRWLDESNWPNFKQQMFGTIAPPMNSIIAAKARKTMQKQLHAHGLGRHSRNEIYSLACKDINELALLLEKKTWFGGDFVSKLDLAAIAYLTNLLIPELPSPMAACIKQHSNLIQYVQRSYPILFPDPVKKRRIPGQL